MTRLEIIVTVRGGSVQNVHVNKAGYEKLMPNVRIIDYDNIENCSSKREEIKERKKIMEAELDRDSSEFLNIY